MNDFIPLSVPNIKGNERKYINEALDQEWVSSAGPHILKFEDMFKRHLNIENTCACQSGTAGLHLCLIAMGIEQNDIVLVPTLTFVATVNSVMYQKATPVFIDCDDSLGISISDIKDYLENQCEVINKQTIEKGSGKIVKAIIPVHVFGNTSDMESIMAISEQYNLKVIEDATESLGGKYISGKYKGMFTGTIGHTGVFSFNGNKIITTGGGGMIVSRDQILIDKIRYLSTQAKDDQVYFIHNEVGFNYRLTNLQAALGMGQMEQLNNFISIKEKNYFLYKELLKNNKLGYIMKFHDYLQPNYWFYSFVLNVPNAVLRDEIIECLSKHSIQTRPIWKLNHTQKPFEHFKIIGGENAEIFYNSIINIPCSTNLKEEDVRLVADLLNKIDIERRLLCL